MKIHPHELAEIKELLAEADDTDDPIRAKGFIVAALQKLINEMS